MKLQDVLPVVLSVIIIIAVAILQKESKLAAALTATMPLTAPLALWIVYSSSGGDRTAVTQFTQGLLVGVLPSLGFLIAVWQASRAGLTLLPTLLVGFAVWAVGALVIVGFSRYLGL